MKLFKQSSEKYVNWVIKLGKGKSAIFGFIVLALSAILLQMLLDCIFFNQILAIDILRSVLFGLISAPFTIYFFNVIVEKLEKSRVKLEQNVYELNLLREQDYLLQKQLEKNNQDKTKLMATISHELRTPLNGIIGLSRILLEGELNPQQQEYLKTINISAISLGHIFSDIIDLEKIDNKRIELFNKPVEFIQLISDIHHFAQLMASKKQIQFQLNYPQNHPLYINVDNARLSQILWNLLSNAFKFTPPHGKVSLNIQSKANGFFDFIITDSGIGIAPEEQDKIFTMFYQSENSRGQHAQGSGIGLAVSKQIAQKMKGDVKVQSELGKGSTFTLSIQAEEVDANETAFGQYFGLNVLLVEDVEVNVIVAQSMLEKFGCHIDVATSGEQAYHLFEQHSYDLILLDIQLPDTTGFAIAQTLRERYEREEIDYLPMMIAFTANVIHTKEEYLALGMDDVLRKPLSLEALSSCLEAHFDLAISQKNEDIQPLADLEQPVNNIYHPQLLNELLAVMGKQGVLDNLALLEQTMPHYLHALQQAYQRWQSNPTTERRQQVVDHAHKIKGAFASVALTRLQSIAELAQTIETVHDNNGIHWEKNIEDWISQINQTWKNDLEKLKAKIEKDRTI